MRRLRAFLVQVRAGYATAARLRESLSQRGLGGVTSVVPADVSRRAGSNRHCPGSSVVEHLLGKEEVVSSILILGSRVRERAREWWLRWVGVRE